MRKKSIVTKTAALFMATTVGVMSIGCSTKDQTTSNERNSKISTETEESSSEYEQDETVTGGMGRYIETNVLEGETFYDKVEQQILSDGQIVFLNSLKKQKFVSKDNGTTWNMETDESFSRFIEEHYPAASAIAKDGTIAIVGSGIEICFVVPSVL